MTIVFTGTEKLDKGIAEKLKAKQAFYADYLLEEKDADTVILSTNIETEIPFKDFLFALRRDNKRVILLTGDAKSPYIGYALALGIYDLIFDPVSEEKIEEVYHAPRQFSDVAHFYLGLQGKVSFESARTTQNGDGNPEGAGDAEVAVKQLYGIFKLIGRGTNKHNVNEMLLDLEQILIQQFI